MYLAEEQQSWELSSLAGSLDPTPWQTSRGLRRSILQSFKRRQQHTKCAGLCTADSGPAALAHGEFRDQLASAAFPDFFQWIYDDLAPWKETGIREANVMAGKKFAAFRVVILNGVLYVDMYYRCMQSRGFFTLWSLVQLLERFPGQVPDVDFMFDCMDRPHFEKARFPRAPGVVQPALLGYCSTDEHLDIPFPDWSFWGWPEMHLKQWHNQSISILRGSEQLEWKDRDGWAYWRGNPNSFPTRQQLMLCNQSPANPSSKARILRQDWKSEAGAADGPRDSDVARHCDHKYMVYAEGYAWSASYKYIMACGSPVLAIASNYYEFFTRGLLPMHHYVPVSQRAEDICSSIDALVMAGNAMPEDMVDIGERGRKFMLHDLFMGNVYSYMFHLLAEYSKLMRYQPAVPPRA